MGTTYAVVLSGAAACTPALARPVEAELQRVNAQMSTWRPDSEVSRFNRAATGEWLAVSSALVDIVLLSQELAYRSEGAFDIRVGPLVELWGFGPEARIGRPKAAEIHAVAARVGQAGLQVRRDPPGLRKATEGLRIDLSAIAKGHAVDRLAALLDDNGCTDYLIEIGGELRLGGRNPRGQAWRVGVTKPTGADGGVPMTGNIVRILQLTDVAVATSGDYRNLRRAGDFGFGHTIDPRTGYPVAHHLASVTVIADSAALADGLATLINVLGPADGLAFANREGVAALVVLGGGDGGFEQRYTEAMRAYLD